MNRVFISGALRTAVAPRDGAFRHVEPAQLAGNVIAALLKYAQLPGNRRIEVILGNALYGGGNPARVAALAAGLPIRTPALTIDTQCCSGLDAIIMAASRIRSGEAEAVIAGGVESYSRAPLRFSRPLSKDDRPQFYSRPPFTPWRDRDPDLIESAAALAVQLDIERHAQEDYAMESHRKALAHRTSCQEIADVAGVTFDPFTREINGSFCKRLPVIAGDAPHGLTAATIAVEADAAAAVMLVNESVLKMLSSPVKAVEYCGGITIGYDPTQPALAPIEAARSLLMRHSLKASDLRVVEIMEAFAAQAMAFNSALGLSPADINRGGGALARGHPIGASGAILTVRLFHELQCEEGGAMGLAAIAAAGGLGSALLLQRREF